MKREAWQWHYLSCVNDAGFQGGAVVYASSVAQAAAQAASVGMPREIEVLVIPMPEREVPDRRFCNRRLTEAEVRELFGPCKTWGELKDGRLN